MYTLPTSVARWSDSALYELTAATPCVGRTPVNTAAPVTSDPAVTGNALVCLLRSAYGYGYGAMQYAY